MTVLPFLQILELKRKIIAYIRAMLGELTLDGKDRFNSLYSRRRHARVGPALIFAVLCNQGFHRIAAERVLVSVGSRSRLTEAVSRCPRRAPAARAAGAVEQRRASNRAPGTVIYNPRCKGQKQTPGRHSSGSH